MEEEQHSNKNQKIIAAAVVLVAVVLVAFGVSYFSGKKKDETTNTPTTAITDSSNTNTAASTTTYKNGSYSAEGKYVSPGGQEGVSVTVTLKDGIVTDSTVETTPASPDSKEYQSDFKSGYKSQVIGKSLESIQLSRVSGSSLTSQGFNEALDTIKSQAKS